MARDRCSVSVSMYVGFRGIGKPALLVVAMVNSKALGAARNVRRQRGDVYLNLGKIFFFTSANLL